MVKKDKNSQNIIRRDLSHFNSSLINNIKNMIHKCSSLEYLDVLISFDGISNMISYSESIKYINLSYVKNNDNFKKKFQIVQI